MKLPINELSNLAKKESWRKEINRPIYHLHKWWAQRLGTTFRALLIYLSEDGDFWDRFYSTHDDQDLVVFDPFMGSGTTIGEAIKLGMQAIGNDINPVSSFLVEQEFTNVDLTELDAEYKKLEKSVAPKIKNLYKTESGDDVLYYFWVKTTPDDIPLFSSFIFSKNAYPRKHPECQIICPECWKVFQGSYFDEMVRCPHCHNYFDPHRGNVSSRSNIKGLLPKNGRFQEQLYAKMVLKKDGTKQYESISDYDRKLYASCKSRLSEVEDYLPSAEIEAGYNTDQALGYGYRYWRDFFNDRQLLALGYLAKGIMDIKNDDVRNHFLCLFSGVLEYNNMFCSFKGEGTGAVRPIFSNHILKPERMPLENSIWGTYKSSGCFSSLYKSRLIKAKTYLDNPFEIARNGNEKIYASHPMRRTIVHDYKDFTKNSILILNKDSRELTELPDQCVDLIVTDPPYFDFIHYSELSDFFYAWLAPLLGRQEYSSRRTGEVQQVDERQFSALLGEVFLECNRLMKDNGKLAFSFHHSRAEGWIAIMNALISSGFYISEVFCLHDEAMASTPKASAKKPISLDAVIICTKEKPNVEYNVQTDIAEQISNLDDIGEADRNVIKFGCFLKKGVNERWTAHRYLNETF